MQTRTRHLFTTIRTEGIILPADLLQRIVGGDSELEGLSPESYHLSGEKLNEAINRSWTHLLGCWAAFRTSAEKLPDGDPGTTVTREKWLLPLFQELGFGRLTGTKTIEIEGKSYPVSHGWGHVPIHLVGCNVDIDKRALGVTGASRMSPHSLVQEFLNRDQTRLWGFVSNGLTLRVLRDNATLTRQAYVEFDLEAMMTGEVYADFGLLWLVCHQSRVEGEKPEECWLEKWSKTAQERGTRALDSLRQGVEGAIAAFGSGFLRHPLNQKLRTALRSGTLSTQEYYRQLLRLVYRLIFLFVAEDRDLLFDPASSPAARERYLHYYSLVHLRRLAEHRRGGRHPDLYAALRLVTDILGGRKDPRIGKTGLGLPVLGGFLFAGEALRDLESAELDNESLLSAIRHLTFMDEGRTRRAVDYKNLGSEELGSIYESLLELHPLVNTDAATFELTEVSGSERKTTGSYYTPSSLIQVLLDSALEPVMEQAVKAQRDASQQEKAILDLKICDPACGSGHFLVAAAHRLARRLAAVRTGEGEPAPEALRSALRAAISNCIYGVDINPMSVELCKVSLWMEALEPGKPLSFLDAHIHCGDSLVGVSPNLDISEIPDEAFIPAFGDDKFTAAGLKKRNKRERTGQMGFRISEIKGVYLEDFSHWLADRAAQVDAMPEDDPAQVKAKSKAFDDWHATHEYMNNRFELDLWTAAFFWSIPKADAETMLAPTQQELIQLRIGGELDARLVECVKELAKRLNFFHWELAFPKVFSGENSGFNCVLGNPPWERIKLQEEEFFAQRDPEIAIAPNKAARQKLIDALQNTHLVLATEFRDVKCIHDKQGNFMRTSNRYLLTGAGDVNTYALFAELARKLISPIGRVGLIVPTGIATDDATKAFFSDLSDKHALISLFDFENREGIFPGVHRSYKFCLLTMSHGNVQRADFVFFCTRIEHLNDNLRHFTLTSDEISIFNPNTRTAPVFRNRPDADIAKNIYLRVPIFVNERDHDGNAWGVEIGRMFHSSEDSDLFIPTLNDSSNTLPLYEAKCFWQYDHRYSTYENEFSEVNPVSKLNPNYFIKTRYSVSNAEIPAKYCVKLASWYLAYRRITSPTNERTLVSSIIPKCGLLDSGNVIYQIDAKSSCLLLANLNALVTDYLCRQTMGGNNLHVYIMQQIPILPPVAYTPIDIKYISPRVLELVYSAYDLRPFSEDMGYHGEPFRWEEVRRAQLRAELDAYYARLYGLTRDELRYILDPKEVYGEDFPGETFRVLKDKEIRQFGEYRTRRLVLEAWDNLEG
jgi:hypothetical protein